MEEFFAAMYFLTVPALHFPSPQGQRMSRKFLLVSRAAWFVSQVDPLHK